jgi:hypothetical protein
VDRGTDPREARIVSQLSPNCVAEIVALVGSFVTGVILGLIGRFTRRK